MVRTILSNTSFFFESRRQAMRFSVMLSLCYLFAPAAFANSTYLNLTMGGGLAYSSVSSSQTLILAKTPAPGITNFYSVDNSHDLPFLFGIGAGYRFSVSENSELALGIQADYLNYRSIEGVVHPMVNVAPDFDTLNFSYDAQSYVFLFQPTWFYITDSGWNPFVGFGVGMAWNRFYSYTESPPIGSTASPTMFPFRNYTTMAFAYAPCVGVEYALAKHINLHLAYQYFSTGNASLNTEQGQQTNQEINSSSLNAHMLTLSILFA